MTNSCIDNNVICYIEISKAIKQEQKSLEQRIEEIKELEASNETKTGNEFFSLSVEYRPGIWQEQEPSVYFNNVETESTASPYYSNIKQEDIMIEQQPQERIAYEIEEAKLLSGTGLAPAFTYKTAAQEEIMRVQRIINFTLNTVLYDIY